MFIVYLWEKPHTYSLVPLAMNVVNLLYICVLGIVVNRFYSMSFETMVMLHAVLRELKIKVNEVRVYIQMVVRKYSNVKSIETEA